MPSPGLPALLSTPTMVQIHRGLIMAERFNVLLSLSSWSQPLLPCPGPSRPTLSSFSHFSSSCLRPCCSTGLHSSKDSNLLSWPWSSRIPKYCNNGEAWPGWAGTLWNLRIVSAVRRIPWGMRRKIVQLYSDNRTISGIYPFVHNDNIMSRVKKKKKRL